jgi:tetratricopeptide (TPR) repeat protein
MAKKEFLHTLFLTRSCLFWVHFLLLVPYVYSQKDLSDDPFSKLHKQLQNSKTGNPERWLELADYHLRVSQMVDSVSYYGQKLFEWSKKEKDSLIYGKSCWFIGRAAQIVNENDKAALYLREATRLAKKHQDTALFIRSSVNWGTIIKSKGKFKKALGVYKEGLSWITPEKEPDITSAYYSNLGVLYINIGDEDLGLKYYLEALKYARLAGSEKNQGIIFTNLSNIYSDKNQLNLSRSYLKRAEKLYLASKEYGLLAYSYGNESNIFFLEKNYDSVYSYANKVFQLRDSVEVPLDALAVAYNNMGEAFMAEKKYNLASNALNEAERLALEARDIDLIPHIYKVKSDLYEKTGKPYKSLAYLKKHLVFTDSIYNKKVLQQTAQFESETALSAKEQEIASLEETSILQQSKYKGLLSWLVGIVFLLVLGIIFAYIYYLKQRTKESELRKEAAENKLEALRNQMNPHFLFNSFNAIQHYILKSEKDNAYNYLTRVAHLIRKVLDNAGNMTIDFESELEILSTYLELETLRFQDKFTHELTVENLIKEINPTIPSMVIQPYIENAILHGLSNRQAPGGKLTISFKMKDDDILLCTIEDNGIGRKQAMQIRETKPRHMQGNKIAMNNTSKRLRILERAGYPHGEVNIKDLYDQEGNASGTRVTITLKILD